jgi:hypothetical protein
MSLSPIAIAQRFTQQLICGWLSLTSLLMFGGSSFCLPAMAVMQLVLQQTEAFHWLTTFDYHYKLL